MSKALTLERKEETISGLDQFSERLDRPREELVSKALEDWIAFQRKLVRKIEEGIAAADRGDFVSEQEIERIVNTYRTAG